MLQTNLGGAPNQIAVFNPSISSSLQATEIEPVVAPCSTTAKLLFLLEEITGWKAEFEESNSSLQRRKLSTSKTEPAQGTISIVDMSADWPAQKPTGHRGKCDELVAVINHLVGEMQTAQVELNRIQSALVALDATADIEDDALVDSFVPKFSLSSNLDVDSSDSMETDEFADDDFEVHQYLSDSLASPVCPPFEGWSFGGSTGIVDNYYLDWMVDGEEHISMCAGEIDPASGNDVEIVILIDPLTNEFRVVPDERDPGRDHSLQAFYLWDSNTLTLSGIIPSSNWQRLKSHQAIVATTATKIGEIESWQPPFETHFENSKDNEFNSSLAMAGSEDNGSVHSVSTQSVSAVQLAEMIAQELGSSDPLLVLKRD